MTECLDDSGQAWYWAAGLLLRMKWAFGAPPLHSKKPKTIYFIWKYSFALKITKNQGKVDWRGSVLKETVMLHWWRVFWDNYFFIELVYKKNWTSQKMKQPIPEYFDIPKWPWYDPSYQGMQKLIVIVSIGNWNILPKGNHTFVLTLLSTITCTYMYYVTC